MNFNYHEQEYEEFPNFKGGEKSLYAKMFHDEKNRIIYGKLIPGASIGVHTHETNSEIIYITKGTGRVPPDVTVQCLPHSYSILRIIIAYFFLFHKSSRLHLV